MRLKPVAIAPAVRRQVEQTGREFLRATVEVCGDLPDVDVAANEMLSSVFGNLLGNGVLHNDTPNPNVVVSAVVDDEFVTVRVSDDGPGIPDALADSLFGRGEKGMDSPGTGMGPYLVAELVEGYGGDVHVEPNDPRGSTFVVTLPLDD
jgi:signal transduction histidine kinase